MTSIARDLAWALDPVLFAREALQFKADEWQARVLRWNGKRLLMNCSRQSGKSTTTAIKALHTALYRPGVLVLVVSPSLRQSSELFRKIVDFLNVLPDRPELAEDNRLSVKFESGARIVSLPGTEATVRGYSGPGLILEDEASRVPDELHYGALRPMLAVSGGQMMLLSTPNGKVGHFYKEWTGGAGGDEWERVEVKASECPRIARDFLESERRALGDWFYNQEYGCEFNDASGQLFSEAVIDRMFTENVKPIPLFDEDFKWM